MITESERSYSSQRPSSVAAQGQFLIPTSRYADLEDIVDHRINAATRYKWRTTHPGPLRFRGKQSPLQSFMYGSKSTAAAGLNIFMVKGTIMVKSTDGLEKTKKECQPKVPLPDLLRTVSVYAAGCGLFIRKPLKIERKQNVTCPCPRCTVVATVMRKIWMDLLSVEVP